MDTARRIVAIVVLVGYLPPMLYWLLVHPLRDRFRTIGIVRSEILLISIMGGAAAALFLSRGVLVGGDLGTSWPLVGLAVVLLVPGILIETQCRRVLTLSVFAGLPELEPGGGGKLLCEGAYGRVRHPRYVGAGFGLASVACFANHISTYVTAVVILLLLHVIVLLEERELLDRFGDAYRDYRSRVPRYVPRVRGGSGSHSPEVEREAIRALLLTPQNELLLIHVREPVTGSSFWITPGGGREPGESALACLTRELHEETGLTSFEAGPEVWWREHHFTWAGRTQYQRERFFLVPTTRFEPSTDAMPPGADEETSIQAFRWWSAGEIEASSELFVPRELATHLGSLLRDGPPVARVNVGV